jgi:hypothetical protein
MNLKYVLVDESTAMITAESVADIFMNHFVQIASRQRRPRRNQGHFVSSAFG